MRPTRTVTFEDEPLADGTVCRRYDDGRIEWRRHTDATHAAWRDEHGLTGSDELLGDGIVKRVHADGRVEYAREQGFGRTAWSGGLLTVNRTSLGGRAGALLTMLGVSTWMGTISPPPETLTAAQEEELRRRAAASETYDHASDAGSSDGLATHDPGHDGDDLGGDDSDSDFG